MAGLTAITARTRPEGRHHDAGGLWLYVRPSGARSWVLRVTRDGRRREIGLGAYPAKTLAQARAEAARLRGDVKAGGDVIAARREARSARLEAGARTFEAVALLAHAGRTFGTPALSQRWIGRLRRFAFPVFGQVPVENVTPQMVLTALDPIWAAKPETARRVRQLVGAVLRFAHVRGWRDACPALADFTREGLQAHDRIPRHHAAVEYANAPAVFARLAALTPSMGRLALTFAVLTAARSGEARGATWGEIDLAGAMWTIPAARMKMGRDHVVPLSPAVLAVLRTAAGFRATTGPQALVFPGAGDAVRPLTDVALAKANRLIAPAATVHGWRSTFRDWAGETTEHPADVVETALAHLIGNATTRAYQRGNLLEKRRALMNDWAGYLASAAAQPEAASTASPGGDVIAFTPRRAA